MKSLHKLMLAAVLTIALFGVGYSGETGVGILAGGIAGCMMNEAYQEIKKPVPPPQPTMQNTSKHECRALCDDRYPRAAQHEFFLQCLDACR